MAKAQSQLEQRISAKGWNLSDLSRQSGVPYSSIQKYVQHGIEPGVFNALKIARALGVDVVDIWQVEGGKRASEESLAAAVAKAVADGAERITNDIRAAMLAHRRPSATVDPATATEDVAQAQSEADAHIRKGKGARAG